MTSYFVFVILQCCVEHRTLHVHSTDFPIVCHVFRKLFIYILGQIILHVVNRKYYCNFVKLVFSIIISREKEFGMPTR